MFVSSQPHFLFVHSRVLNRIEEFMYIENIKHLYEAKVELGYRTSQFMGKNRRKENSTRLGIPISIAINQIYYLMMYTSSR